MKELNIKYRILSIDETNHSFVIRYFTDIFTEEKLATQFDENGNIIMLNDYPISCRTDTNLTLWKLDATPEEIDTLIKNSAPSEWFKIQTENLNKQSISLDHIKNNVGQVQEFNHKFSSEIELTDEEIDNLIENLQK